MSEVAISVTGLVACLGERTILDIPALTIREGERVAILGHNGAGKSTLLRILTGFTAPHFGEARVLGRALRGDSTARELLGLRQDVGQVLQGLHLVGRLSAIENVLIGALRRVPGWRSWTRCFPESEIRKAQAALHKVGLLARQHTRADRLSGGERQKVAIARMLLQESRLILADEPTAALDPSAAAEVCRLLAQAAAGATLVSVVHNPALMPLLAERAIGLRQGKVFFDLPVAQMDDRQLMALYRPGGGAAAAHWHLDLGKAPKEQGSEYA